MLVTKRARATAGAGIGCSRVWRKRVQRGILSAKVFSRFSFVSPFAAVFPSFLFFQVCCCRLDCRLGCLPLRGQEGGGERMVGSWGLEPTYTSELEHTGCR